MDEEGFRRRVLAILREQFPQEEFLCGDQPQIICWRDVEFGLRNLHTDITFAGANDEQLRDRILTHFARVINAADFGKQMLPQDWSTAQPRLRLQLMPAEFSRNALSVSYPFLDSVLVSVVIDSDSGYAYVRQEDLKNWQISPIDLYEVACENLKAASRGMEIAFYEGPPPFIALQTQDGYDAARILLPELRQFAIEKLGTPFFAAIPNRDFLILWSHDCDAEFQARMQAQVSADFASRSHPLTAAILSVAEESIDLARL